MKKSDQRGIGIELLIADARMLGGKALGDWFTQISEVYRFCVARGDQFVLSSGATAASELVSGSCMDAILARCGINPKRHWAQVADWLDETLSKRILGIAP